MRDHTKYPGQTTKVPALGAVINLTDIFAGDAGNLDDLFIIPARVAFSPTSFHLTFRAWRSIEQFETNQQPVIEYLRKIRVFSDNYAEFYIANKTVIDTINSTANQFLGVNNKFNRVEGLVDLEHLTIRIKAFRKGKRNQEIKETVEGDVAWDKAVADNQVFADSLIGFAWSYGKSRSKFLNKLTPIT